MDKLVIKGGVPLKGEITISAAKNSILPIIAASILSGDKCIINNAPTLEDVYVICDLLSSMNTKVSFNDNNIYIDTSGILSTDEPDGDLVRKMRASFLIMGPMLSRFGKVKISLPGGCNIGTRPIDLHLKGFRALGANIDLGYGYVEAKAEKLKGNNIYLDFPSVGATENIMMAAVLAEGETIIENAAEEPEIKDLANFLIQMGANIQGAGSDTIRITGVKNLHGVSYTPIFDRIEAGTYMIAAAITNSKVKISGVEEEYLRPVIAKLIESGASLEIGEKFIIVNGHNGLRAMDIKTMPYPGFPTDMQAQIMSLACLSKGTSIITETVFENRFMHAGELKRMGANIKIDGRCAIIEGVKSLSGCNVKATDLRAGAALILAALCADGVTTINDIYHIDRGYVSIEEKFKKLGANIERIK
ncbi:UDP-N-acetylglucosamine 1-carboxyvinyltransferase [Clostridium hydrogeniformans]|uniref:UDP-N-acetylglucosamine 1-carboxyvinyltransferase n=1 Tax=Clostridium hydrogeniformans TaxID=349933 RepID=UPI0004844468|nr:UDP-N-acetylglucosamine 1-carboxyvinyltransferase [Clostridium hydrogeniformans]